MSTEEIKLLDHYAGLVFQGILINGNWSSSATDEGIKEIVALSYKASKMMLTERARILEKEEKKDLCQWRPCINLKPCPIHDKVSGEGA